VQLEDEIQCPYCAERITVFVDPSQERQSYVEDCSVCCRPIEIVAACDPDSGELLWVQARRG